MQQHVSALWEEMFRRPLTAARSKLTSKCKTGEREFLHKIDELVRGMKTEYHRAIIGRNLSKFSKKARGEVAKVLARSDNKTM